ncbi:unnamed protein product [Eretmochelys imbricata]
MLTRNLLAPGLLLCVIMAALLLFHKLIFMKGRQLLLLQVVGILQPQETMGLCP